ncbi:MAG: hypothetical protein D3923_03565 [Candidatus Electrothrix sp. AR3]|nr:hypothetical protein [Candidatus Electrothrix sp. AR3]
MLGKAQGSVERANQWLSLVEKKKLTFDLPFCNPFLRGNVFCTVHCEGKAGAKAVIYLLKT